MSFRIIFDWLFIWVDLFAFLCFVFGIWYFVFVWWWVFCRRDENFVVYEDWLKYIEGRRLKRINYTYTLNQSNESSCWLVGFPLWFWYRFVSSIRLKDYAPFLGYGLGGDFYIFGYGLVSSDENLCSLTEFEWLILFVCCI